MKHTSDRRKAGMLYTFAIIPVILITILFYFLTVRDEIIKLAEEKFSLRSRAYSYDIATWTETVLSELEIYRDIVAHEGGFSDRTFEMISSSANVNKAYPHGIYWGDENNNYFDSSGWVPDDDYVPTECNWYQEGLKHSHFVFGEPYIDRMTGQSCISATAKVEYDNTVSVLAADIYLDYTSEVLNGITSDDIESAFFVTRKNRVIIGSSDNDKVGKRLNDAGNSVLYRSIDRLIAEEFVGQTTVKDGVVYYVNISKMNTTDWFFVTCIKSNMLFAEMRTVEYIMGLLSIVASGTIIFSTLKLSRKMNDTYREAQMDPLTKLLNRSGFRSASEAVMEDRPDQGILLLFDMDNFKQINDQLGHPEGDIVLKKFAGLLNEYFNRAGDITSRLGGDEFAVFAGRDMSHSEVSSMLRRFISLFHEAFDEKYAGQALSVSIGAAFAVDSEGNYTTMYHNADKALYNAKQNGKDTYIIM